MRRSGSRAVISGTLAVMLVFNFLGASVLSMVRPARAHAMFVADDVAAVAIVAGAAAVTYGAVSLSQWQAQGGVSDKSTAALAALGTQSGAISAITLGQPAVFSYLMAMRAGMAAQGLWDGFVAAAESAYAYGGYLWANLTGGLYGNLAFQSAGTGAVSYPDGVFMDLGPISSVGGSGRSGVAAILSGSITAAADANSQGLWAIAQIAAAGGLVPVGLTFDGSGSISYLRRFGVVWLTIQDYWHTASANTAVAADITAWLTANPGTVVGGAIDVPQAKVYADNPDVLPIPADVTLANIGTAEVGAIAVPMPTPADPVPWVPPVWLPKAPDISGIGNDLRGLASEVANLFGETWAWLSAPFAGLLTGLAAITDWLNGLIAWMEQTIASIFSPSGTQLKLEFEPRWNDLKAKLDKVWPFALVGVLSLVIDSIMGGDVSGGRTLDNHWTVTLYEGVSFDISLAAFLDPIASLRWWLVAGVWLELAVAVYRLLKPQVVT